LIKLTYRNKKDFIKLVFKKLFRILILLIFSNKLSILKKLFFILSLFNYNVSYGILCIKRHRKFRSSNEDFYYAENNLLIVADGMGGHNAGEIASKYAISYFVEHFKSLLSSRVKENSEKKQIEKTNNLSKMISKNNTADKIQKMMIESIEYANSKIYKMGLENEEYSGMGTTFTCLFIKNEKCYVVHVGDSRLYLYRNSELNLLTEDHTFVFALYKKGAITYKELFSHPQRNYLTGIIGKNEI